VHSNPPLDDVFSKLGHGTHDLGFLPRKYAFWPIEKANAGSEIALIFLRISTSNYRNLEL
jgi:hypothetical protein